MGEKIKTKFKKLISVIVCLMMVAGTVPIYCLNSAVFAGNGAVVQTEAVPNEAENAEDEDLANQGPLNQTSENQDNQAVETANEVEDVSMEGGKGQKRDVYNFDDLKEAIENANNNDIIVLTDDIDITDEDVKGQSYALQITGNKKVTITSSGGQSKRIICEDKGSLLNIDNEARVTFTNVIIDGKGCLRNRDLVNVGNKCSLVLGKKSQIRDCKNSKKVGYIRGGAIHCEGGTVEMTAESKIVGCTSERRGGAIYCDNGTVTMNGGKIERCEAEKGGAICCMNGKVILNKDSAIMCYDHRMLNFRIEQGGAIYCEDGEVNINQGSRIYSCSAEKGGAIYCCGVFKKATVTMSGGTIEQCLAKKGGAVCCNKGGTVTMNEGTIELCEADDVGGAVCCNEGGTVTMNGGTIKRCRARNGGAIYCDNGTVTMNGGTIEWRKDWDCGNAIYVREGGALSLIEKSSEKLKIEDIGQVDKFLRRHITDSEKTGRYIGIYLEKGAEISIIPSSKDRPRVFKVGTFEKLRDAVIDAYDGDTIKLTKDICVDSDEDYALEVAYAHKNITITSADDKVKLIQLPWTKSLLKISGKGSGVIFEKVKIQVTAESTSCSLIRVGENCSLTLGKESTICGCKCSLMGAAIYCDRGNVKMTEGSSITDCYTEMYPGGAIYCCGGTVEMNRGSKIIGCHALPKFIAYSQGGAIYCCEKGVVKVNKGNIENCSAREGGAIYCADGTVNIIQSSIRKCHAKAASERDLSLGGAIYCFEKGTVNMENVQIEGCSANKGGAICFMKGTVNIISGEIFDCSADIYGNAIFGMGGDLLLPKHSLKQLTITKKDDVLGTDVELMEYDGIYLEGYPKNEFNGFVVIDRKNNKYNNVNEIISQYDNVNNNNNGNNNININNVPVNNNNGNGNEQNQDGDNNLNEIIDEDENDNNINNEIIDENDNNINNEIIDEGQNKELNQDDNDNIDNEYDNAFDKGDDYDFEDEEEEEDKGNAAGNETGSSQDGKNDFLATMAPWLIGAAVVAVVAAAAIVVVKKKNGSGV